MSGEAAADHLEVTIGRVLGIAVRVSAILLAAGLIAHLTGWWPGASRALLAAGLVTLMATPPCRVVVSALEYARTRDWFFLSISIGVLLVLVTTAVLAVLE